MLVLLFKIFVILKAKNQFNSMEKEEKNNTCILLNAVMASVSGISFVKSSLRRYGQMLLEEIGRAHV